MNRRHDSTMHHLQHLALIQQDPLKARYMIKTVAILIGLLTLSACQTLPQTYARSAVPSAQTPAPSYMHNMHANMLMAVYANDPDLAFVKRYI